MDLNKLRTLVFEKSAIKVDTTDPIFALVALNEAVLSECVEPHVAVLHDAADQLSARTTQLLDAAGGVALLSAVLTAGAQWLIAPKQAPAQVAPANPAPALTPEQVLLIKNGEKYKRMWTKLDAKTQAEIQALLQQPESQRY